jgi:3-carboxy-cis,cis-muconate cycloisomerase
LPLVRQLRAALQIVAGELRELREILAVMTRKHRDTATAGRTVRSHCDPMNYAGLAPQMVDNVLARPNRN